MSIQMAQSTLQLLSIINILCYVSIGALVAGLTLVQE